MSASFSESARIAQLSKACLDSLTRSCSFLHGDNHQKLAHQFSLFHLWTQNIGVFSGPTSSLDHRLRAAPRMSLAVLDIIEVIQIQADKIIQLQKDHGAEQSASLITQRECQPESFPSSDWPESRQTLREPASPSVVEDTIRRMEGDIGWLYNLTLIIRRAGHKDPFSSAANFPIHGQDKGKEYDMTEAFYESIETRLSESYAALSRNIRDRLVDTVGLRRRYLLYCQSHKRKLAYDSYNTTSSSPLQQGPDSRVAPSVTHATEYEEQPSHPAHLADASTISGQSSFSSGLVSTAPIPPAPQLEDQEKEHECPYCCIFLPRDTFTIRGNWIHHVKQDLRPYVCVHEVCSHSHPMFASSKEWRQHMCKPHKTQWICAKHLAEESSSNQQTGIFDSQEALRVHLETDHGETYTRHQVSILSQRNQTITPVLARCPFCNEFTLATTRKTNEEAATDPFLYRHIANHLVEIALMSLPVGGGDEEFDETNDSDKGLSSINENPVSDGGNQAGSPTQDQGHSMNRQGPAALTDIGSQVNFPQTQRPLARPRLENSPERANSRSGSAVITVSPRYIDHRKLMSLLDALFGNQKYSVKITNGKYKISTPRALTTAELQTVEPT